MAGFLRKKTKQEPPMQASAAPPAALANAAPPPLYARFALSSTTEQPMPAPPRLVSGPMVLSKRDSRSHGPDKPARRNVTGPSPRTPTDYAAISTPSPPARNFGSASAHPVPETASRTMAYPDPQSVKKDKPLPSLHPAEPSDMLSSAPPQSSLPPSRRFSNRVVPQNTPSASVQVSDAPHRTFSSPVHHPADSSPLPSPSVLPPDPVKPLFPSESLFSTPKSRPVHPTPAATSDHPSGRRPSQTAQQPPPNSRYTQRRQSLVPKPSTPPQQVSSIDSQPLLARPVSNDIKPEDSQVTVPPSEPPSNMSATATLTQASAPTAYHMGGTPRKSNSQRSISSPTSGRGKPLIFTAMTTVPQPEHHAKAVSRQPQPQASYPSPPAEYSHPPITMHHQSFNSSTASLPRYRNAPANNPPHPSSRNSTVQTPRTDAQPLPQTPPRTRQLPESHHRSTPSRAPSDASTSANSPSSRRLTKHRPTTPVSLDQEARSSSHHGHGPAADVPYFADDPFAKVDGVKVIPPTTTPPPSLAQRKFSPSPSKGKDFDVLPPMEEGPVPAQHEIVADEAVRPQTPPPPPRVVAPPRAPPTPPSPEEYKRTRRGHTLEKSPPRALASLPVKEDRPAEPFLLDIFLAEVGIVTALLPYLSFYEWLVLGSVTKKTREVVRIKSVEYEMKEAILERFLKTVGYSRWAWEREPLELTLEDLYDYMRGVTLPTHEYSRTAQRFLQTHASQRDSELITSMKNLTASTRSYTRVVLRLRAQAEKEMSRGSRSNPHSPSSRARSRASSRAPSPTFSYSTHGGGHGAHRPTTPVNSGFKSPLFRLRRAPLLQCFVPSPDGDWLSDNSVLQCEAELKRAGVLHLMRVGDVVWDVAVGDEGNVGRLVWDGSYLIDLDYTYSPVGDVPKYLPTLAFSPSYFHRVIRTGPTSSNPIVRIDLSPWGEEIAANLQLLQDRVRTETPQGTYHNVVRWVHRSSFALRPHARSHSSRIPIPESNGLFVDSGWYGTVVVETEGTNESLADLQERCGPGAFPPRAGGVRSALGRDKDSKLVFRILREKSRPGEIWISTRLN